MIASFGDGPVGLKHELNREKERPRGANLNLSITLLQVSVDEPVCDPRICT